MFRIIKNMNVNEPKTKLNSLEMNKRNFIEQQSESEPLVMACVCARSTLRVVL